MRLDIFHVFISHLYVIFRNVYFFRLFILQFLITSMNYLQILDINMLSSEELTKISVPFGGCLFIGLTVSYSHYGVDNHKHATKFKIHCDIRGVSKYSWLWVVGHSFKPRSVELRVKSSRLSIFSCKCKFQGSVTSCLM